MYTYRAKIISVYDGDTVTALVDLGFGITNKIKIRLKGINTPEVRGAERPEGIVSRDYLTKFNLR
jgi:micrococcal nuclease